MNRENERIIYRLRSGSINVDKYLHKIGKSPSEICENCKVTDDVVHFLLVCLKYDAQRKQMFDQLKNNGVVDLSLKHLLSGYTHTFSPVHNYLRETNNVYILIR